MAVLSKKGAFSILALPVSELFWGKNRHQTSMIRIGLKEGSMAEERQPEKTNIRQQRFPKNATRQNNR
jgi:hypothetical protein